MELENQTRSPGTRIASPNHSLLPKINKSSIFVSLFIHFNLCTSVHIFSQLPRVNMTRASSEILPLSRKKPEAIWDKNKVYFSLDEM